jgi:hypothetical protein
MGEIFDRINGGRWRLLFDDSGSGVLASCKTIYSIYYLIIISYHLLPSDVKTLRGKKRKNSFILRLNS